MKALVTGGIGFIGSHVVDTLLDAGHEVVVFDNLGSGQVDNLHHARDKIQIIDADIRNLETLSKALHKVDWVFHLAALTSVSQSVANPYLTNDINTTGTLNVLLAARDANVSRVIFSSSCAIYGDIHHPPLKESDFPNPKTPYASSKLSGEHLAMSFYHSYGLETICLRYFNVYGPRQRANSAYAAVIPRFIKCYQEVKSPIVYGDGHQSRDFIHVYDVARANILAASCQAQVLKNYQFFNIGTSYETSILSLLNTISECFGKYLEPEFKPARIGDVLCSWSDSKLAEEKLNFVPLINLHEGIHNLSQMG